MSNGNDRLVDAYLDAVRRATADLPADRRDDLIGDLREHIAAARAELDPESEAGDRNILDRLGDPSGIAAEAHLGAPPPPRPLPPTMAAPGRQTHAVRNVLLVVVALVVLVCGAGAVVL